jgi:hypothetical protein
MNKTYKETIKLKTFEERFNFLQLHGRVSELTFGQNRYLNQMLYHDPEWKRFKRDIILRDNSCDLAIEDRPIETYKKNGKIIRSSLLIVHHINPITVDDVINRSYKVFDEDNVICCKLSTHNGIHYGGDAVIRATTFVERQPDDTTLWR